MDRGGLGAGIDLGASMDRAGLGAGMDRGGLGTDINTDSEGEEGLSTDTDTEGLSTDTDREWGLDADTDRGGHGEDMDAGETLSIEGSRIINVDKLQQYMTNLTKHATKCQGRIVLRGETRNGLASILTGECTSCQYKILLETSKKVKGPRGYSRCVYCMGGGRYIP